MISTEKLDVTQIEPKLKHPTIFKHFDELDAGEAFTIYNDHDPKPLYYQLLGERGNIFTWEYLESGPKWWLVKIAKRSSENNGEAIGAIAAKDMRKAEVFRKMGIDYSCGGDKTVKEAGTEVGIEEEVLQEALKDAETAPLSASQDYNQWELDFLADYIRHTHHRYATSQSKILQGLATKVAQEHGDQHPELVKLSQSTGYFFQDLANHILKEEKTLFPAVKELVARSKDGGLERKLQPGLVKESTLLFRKEHDLIGKDLVYFRNLTNDYQLPEDACDSYRYLFQKLKEFESDIHQYLHLENNILFPKALEIEKRFDQ